MNGFPCPNPTCTHVFPPAAVAGVTALTCPRCGTLFQFRAGPAVAPPVPPQQRMPPRQLPTARLAPAAPVPPAVPSHPPTSERFDLDALGGGDVSSTPRYHSNSGSGWFALKAAMIVILLGGAALVGVMYLHKEGGLDFSQLFGRAEETAPAPIALKPFQSDVFNYKFQCPQNNWRQDDDIKVAAKANILLKRDAPNAFVAVIAKDYKGHTPGDNELLELLTGRLNDYVHDFKYEQQDEAQIAGQRALRFHFQGQVNELGTVNGEAYLTAYQSIGYVFATWAPEKIYAKAAEEFPELRKGFGILVTQKGPEPRLFQGAKGGYTLQDNEGIWNKHAGLESAFKADLALVGNDREKPNDAAAQATVLVLLLPKAKELDVAAAAARDNLERMQKLDYPKTKLTTIKNGTKEVDGPAPVGDLPGYVTKLRVVNNANRERFVVLGVVQRPEQIVVIQGECPWDRRALWEGTFDQLVSSFRLKKN